MPTMVWSGHIYCFYDYLCARALGDQTQIWSQKRKTTQIFNWIVLL